MDAQKMHVMLDIKDEFKRRGNGTSDIAELLHKDSSVVAKQFAEKNGSQTLLTAYGYAEAAGGRIVFMLDEEWDRLHGLEREIHDLQDALRDREQRLTAASDAISKMSNEIENQHNMIVRLEAKIDKKEETIDRKDAAIAAMLRKSGAFE